MKALIKLCLLGVLVLFLAACGNNTTEIEEDYEPTPTYQAAEPEQTPGDVPAPDPDIDIDWVFELDGVYIPITDLLFYMTAMGMNPGNPFEQETAVEHLVEMQILINRAENHGLGFTDDERQEYISEVMDVLFAMQALDMIDVERAFEFMLIDIVVERLVEHYTSDHTHDQEELDLEFELYLEENSMFLVDINAKYIMSVEHDILEQIYENFGTPGYEDFSELVLEHSMFHEPGTEVESFPLMHIIQGLGLDWFQAMPLFELEEGEVSEVMDLGGILLMVYVYERSDIDLDELEEMFTEQFIFRNRMDFFMNLFEGWVESAAYIVNQAALDALQ